MGKFWPFVALLVSAFILTISSCLVMVSSAQAGDAGYFAQDTEVLVVDGVWKQISHFAPGDVVTVVEVDATSSGLNELRHRLIRVKNVIMRETPELLKVKVTGGEFRATPTTTILTFWQGQPNFEKLADLTKQQSLIGIGGKRLYLIEGISRLSQSLDVPTPAYQLVLEDGGDIIIEKNLGLIVQTQ